MIPQKKENVKLKYEVYDFYENPDGDLLGTYYCRHDAVAKMEEWRKDTDDECLLVIKPVEYE